MVDNAFEEKEMKALILAAGKGSRINSQTNGGPKSLLQLGDTTLLGHSLRCFKAAGITDIVVVTGHRRQEVSDYVAANWAGAFEVVFNPHFETTNVLYSFWLALPYLHGEDFIFLHADTVFEMSVLERLLSFDKVESFVFAVDNHECEEEEMKVLTSDGRVTRVNKTMDPASCDGEFLGIARISSHHIPDLRRHAERLFEEGEFQSFFERAVQRLIDEDGIEVAVADVTGLKWREVDFPEDYAAAKSHFG